MCHLFIPQILHDKYIRYDFLFFAKPFDKEQFQNKLRHKKTEMQRKNPVAGPE